MSTSAVQEPSPAQRRVWKPLNTPQRWLIIAVAAVAGLAGFAKVQQWRAKAYGLTSEVQRAGGRHRSDKPGGPGVRFANIPLPGLSTESHEISFTPGQVTNEWLQRNRPRLSRLAALSLELRNTQVTDAGLAELEAVPGLRKLVLEGAAFTDSSVNSLNRMPQLIELDIARSGVTGDGLAGLRQPVFATLTVSAGQLTPAAMKHLSQTCSVGVLGVYDADEAAIALLPQLSIRHSLILQGDRIGPQCLPLLEQVMRKKNLHSLHLFDTRLGEEDVRTLRRAMPSCPINAMTSEEYATILESVRSQ